MSRAERAFSVIFAPPLASSAAALLSSRSTGAAVGPVTDPLECVDAVSRAFDDGKAHDAYLPATTSGSAAESESRSEGIAAEEPSPADGASASAADAGADADADADSDVAAVMADFDERLEEFAAQCHSIAATSPFSLPA